MAVSQLSEANYPDRKNHRITTISIVILATIFGAVIRGFLVLKNDFPLNDGGLFYTMVKDLLAAGFRLPDFTTFNQINIPFAYPPLPFYLTGALNSWFRIDVIELMRFIPLIFSIFSIPAFYLLAVQLLKSDVQRGISVFVFALLPSTYSWQIMGGGLTRSPGFFFSLLALAFFAKWTLTRRHIELVWAGLFSSLTLLCHLEIFWVLAICCLTLFLLRKPSIKSFGSLLIFGIATLAISSPWWGTVISKHGLTPFIAALQHGNFSIAGPISTLLFLNPYKNIVELLFLFLAVLGMFVVLRGHDWFLPVIWILMIILDPRSSTRSMMIPIALLSAIALEKCIQWIKENDKKRLIPPTKDAGEYSVFSNRWVKVVLLLLVSFAFFSDLLDYYYSIFYYPDSLYATVNIENQEAMQWVKENTTPDSEFLVADLSSSWALDSVGEWFPALTSRKNVITAQGKEWIPFGAQDYIIEARVNLGMCKQNSISCFESWQDEYGLTFKYVYLTNNTQPGTKKVDFGSVLEQQISIDQNYELIYSNSDVRIFEVE